jgi:hypothetical protein
LHARGDKKKDRQTKQKAQAKIKSTNITDDQKELMKNYRK